MARKARVLRVLLLAFSLVIVQQQLTFIFGWTSRPIPKPKTVFDQIFRRFDPCVSIGRGPGRQDYLQRLEANNLAIINDVDDTVAHEVIDFDAKHWSKETLNQAAVKASSKKSFLATLRGSGGGKTRALKELR